MPNGVGKFNYDNGDSFTGNFVNGVIQGVGELLESNGDVYQGQF